MSPDVRPWLVAAALVLAAGCGSADLVRDDRITIEHPTELERVTAPFELRWSDDGPAPEAYAVFVDRDPIAPGRALSDLAAEACDGRSGCDTEAFYATQRIHITERPRVEIANLTPLGGVAGQSPHRVHTATIVLLDDDRRRVGEAHWTVELRRGGAVTQISTNGQPDPAAVERELHPTGRAALGVTGRFEYGPMAEALEASGLRWHAVVALALLAAGAGFVVAAPGFVETEARRATGGGFGGLELGRLALTSLGVLGALVLLRRGVPRRWLVVGGGVVGGIALLAAGGLGDGSGLLLLLGSAALAVAATTHLPLLVDYYRPEVRVRALCGYAAGFVLGLGLAGVVPALAAGAGLTWRAALLFLGGVALAVTGAALPLVDPRVGRWERHKVAAAVRARLGDARRPGGHDDGDDDRPVGDLSVGELDQLRRAAATKVARPALLLAGVVGVFVGPVQHLLLLFLRDRWELTAGSRLLVVGVTLLAAVPALAWVARRGELLVRAGPARLAHLGACLAAVAGIALGAAAAAPWFAATVVLLAVASAGCLALLPVAASLHLTVTRPELRVHASVLLWLSLLAGTLLGDIYASSFGSRFGVVWALEAVAALLLVAAARVTPAIEGADDDADALAAQLVERQVLDTLAARGRHLPLLSCRGINFSYGQLQVLFDVDFSVDDGEMVALLGTNGAGKSTLLRVISGLGTPTRGSVHFRGADITYVDTDKRVRLGISQIPGGKAVFGPMSIVDNLVAFGFSHGRNRAAVDAGIEATFAAFPRLAERRNQLASTLSGGEQQMLALGKAFILRPRVLLIDELSLGLAPKIVGELLEMVQRINAGGTAVVLVEQSVNIALSLVDHAYFMEKGQVRFDGRADELVDRPDLLRSVFLAGAERGLLEAGHLVGRS